MKIIYTFLVLALIAGLSEIVRADNPVIKHRFCADPSPHFFEGRAYLYATNDQDNSGKYCDSTDWRLFSSDDMANWLVPGNSRMNLSTRKTVVTACSLLRLTASS